MQSASRVEALGPTRQGLIGERRIVCRASSSLTSPHAVQDYLPFRATALSPSCHHTWVSIDSIVLSTTGLFSAVRAEEIGVEDAANGIDVSLARRAVGFERGCRRITELARGVQKSALRTRLAKR